MGLRPWRLPSVHLGRPHSRKGWREAAMIAYLMTRKGETDGIVIVDDDYADSDKAEVARAYYCEQLVKQGIQAVAVEFGVHALFEGMTLFQMPVNPNQ